MLGTGSQTVNLDRDGCIYTGTIVHELMHAIGFYHEQNRPDRDEYIKINYANVKTGKKNLFSLAKIQFLKFLFLLLGFASNFDKGKGSYYGTAYDLKSIMQYNEYAFTTNGQKTIIPLNGEELIPSYRKTDAQILTSNDVASVKFLYQCSSNQVTTKAPTTSSYYDYYYY